MGMARDGRWGRSLHVWNRHDDVGQWDEKCVQVSHRISCYHSIEFFSSKYRNISKPQYLALKPFRGSDTECFVASLLPGRPYLFQVRAHNRAGPGPWSESLEVISGAGRPDQPKEPRVTCGKGSSAAAAIISWEAPINNGALILVRL